MSGPRRILTAVLVLTGVGALVAGSWAAAQYRTASFQRPFFANPSGLAVGPDGSVYVGVDGAEIHRYRPDGTPSGGWRLPAPGGALRLRTGASGTLEVATRAGRRLAYDARGSLIEDRADPDAWARFAGGGSARGPSPGGGEARYALEPVGLVRVAPPPETLLVPVPRWPLAAFGARPLLPITALLSLAPLTLVLGLAAARRTNRTSARRGADGASARSVRPRVDRSGGLG